MIATVLASCLSLLPSVERGFRPALSGPESTLDDDAGRYRLHYTVVGDDAVPPDDVDGDGVPDFASRAINALSEADARYAAEGWRTPGPDNGDGESDAVDVYVRDITAFGFAYADVGPDGPTCWMELDPGIESVAPLGIESVAVHELHHCVQYRYTVTSHPWVYEATATWEQYRLHTDDTLQAALDVLWNQRLRGADQPMDTTGGRFEYAGFAVMKWWTEFGGADEDRLVALWEALEAEPDWALALDAASEDAWGLSLVEALHHHATWNRFACSRDDGAHYDDSVHPCTFPATSVNVEELAAPAFSLAAPAGGMLSVYGDLPAGGDDRPVELDCSFDGEGELGIVAVDRDGVAGEEAHGPAGEPLRLSGAVDPDGVFAVVLTSRDEAAATLQCGVERVEAVVEPGPEPGGCSCSSGAGNPAALWLLILLATGPCRTSRRCAAC